MNNIIFVSGIGTNVGKSFATGWLANKLISEGNNVITLKMIQTGNDNFSEDIDVHRKIMCMNYTEEDLLHITAPIIMTYPASPHLAAKLDKVKIDLSKLDDSINILSEKYDIILMEGAGGLMVPITEDYLTVDYIKDKNMPVCLVTNGTLGSINHTLMSLEILKNRNVEIKYVIYNSHFDEDEIICKDTISYIEKIISTQYPTTEFFTMPSIK